MTNDLSALKEPSRADMHATVRKVMFYLATDTSEAKSKLLNWFGNAKAQTKEMYNTKLWNDTKTGMTHVPEVAPTYADTKNMVDGRIIIRDNFEAIFNKYPKVLIFGEDVGKIGDVNQGLEGLQIKFGETRVADTGIREPTIMGQGIGMALRGLRPIAEIQYIDYLVYALQTLTDDLASLRYRTFGKQTAPLIIRTRGHRLEGIWHSGSPMSMILGSLRGIALLVPRNMLKAAGFYNTLLKSDEPAIVVESLNGYRIKEEIPTNLGEFCTPIGVVETVKEGTDITVVSYGSTLRIVEAAAKELLQADINIEVIDIQSLMPFDIQKDIVKSLQKTNRLMVVDEDVPGGASAYILQEILENQNGYRYLDSKPTTIASKPHRPAYGSDGDYFSKPNKEDIFEAAYNLMHEADPIKHPKLF